MCSTGPSLQHSKSVQKPNRILNAVTPQACLTVLHLQKLLLNSCPPTEHNKKEILAICHSIVHHHYTNKKEGWSRTLETVSSSQSYSQSQSSARTGDAFCPCYSIVGGGSTPFFCDGKNLLVSWRSTGLRSQHQLQPMIEVLLTLPS